MSGAADIDVPSPEARRRGVGPRAPDAGVVDRGTRGVAGPGGESGVGTTTSPGAPAGGEIRLRHVRKRYARGEADASAALAVDSLDIPLGGIVAIVGGSGSGKSTLLNLLGGLEAPDRGAGPAPRLDLRLPGERTAHRIAAGDPYPRRRASYVFQQGYLLSQASIGLNLEITRRAAGHRVDDAALRALGRAARLDLVGGGDRVGGTGDGVGGESGRAKRLGDRAVTLSGGQQQRLNIARALGREPAILFADEPTSSLDPRTAAEVLETLACWVRGIEPQADGAAAARPRTTARTRSPLGSPERCALERTMIWVTHDYPLACRFADALIVLAPGRPMPDLETPIELDRSGAGRVTPADIESWLRAERLPPALTERTLPLPERVPSPRAPAATPSGDGGPVPRGDAGAMPCEDVPPLPAARPPASGAGPILANMLAGIRLSWMEAFRDGRFTHSARALQLAAVLALILIVTHGQQAVIGYFDAALADPSLRHVIVQQNMRDLSRSAIDADSLAALDAEILDDAASRRAFGRFSETVELYPEGVDTIARGFVAQAEIGILEKAEPVYAALEVLPLGDGVPGCASTDRVPPGALIDYADELVLIVSRRYVEEYRKMYGVDLCAEPRIDVWDANDPLTFRVVGVAERMPADGYERFDALMQADVWRTWVSRVGKPLLGTYSRAAVYFDRDDHGRVLDALRARAFAFDDEIVSKFERLITTAASLRNTFMAITWLSLGVAVTVAAGLIWSYLSQNAKAIALLRAHDAWRAPLVAAIPFQLTLTFAASLAALLVAVLGWNVAIGLEPVRAAIARLAGGRVELAPVPAHLLADSVPTLALTYAAVVAVGLASLFAWRALHPSLAHELRETE